MSTNNTPITTTTTTNNFTLPVNFQYLTVNDLRQLCRDNNVPDTGLKSVLKTRLVSLVSDDPPASSLSMVDDTTMDDLPSASDSHGENVDVANDAAPGWALRIMQRLDRIEEGIADGSTSDSESGEDMHRILRIATNSSLPYFLDKVSEVKLAVSYEKKRHSPATNSEADPCFSCSEGDSVASRCSGLDSDY